MFLHPNFRRFYSTNWSLREENDMKVTFKVLKLLTPTLNVNVNVNV